MAKPTQAQQFNSDSYLAKPVGTVTTILTAGQRNEMMMLTFSLLPKWEFTASVFIFNSDSNRATAEGYSSSLYAKYMFYENEAKTGGFAAKFGTGLQPGYLNPDNSLNDAFKTFWANAPVTVPFFHNRLSWDVMPGFSATRNLATQTDNAPVTAPFSDNKLCWDVMSGFSATKKVATDMTTDKSTAWAFTYATRLAWYPISPKWSLVGEVVGAEGKGTSPPEYRVGPRWEPNQHVVIALTYDQEIGGHNGAKWEVGAMLFSPTFLCRKCK